MKAKRGSSPGKTGSGGKQGQGPTGPHGGAQTGSGGKQPGPGAGGKRNKG